MPFTDAIGYADMNVDGDRQDNPVFLWWHVFGILKIAGIMFHQKSQDGL